VSVSGQGDKSVVQVLTLDSQPDTSKTAKQILELLYEELQ
jgi:outer membrane protein assembly factor BamC